jgi:hypothetical protein
MAQQEQALWDTLKLTYGHTSGWETTVLEKEPTKTVVENGISSSKLKAELVLKYKPSDIEDTIYFMEHRGYFLIHKAGAFSGLMVYGLTDKALKVLSDGVLPKEEQIAFREALWDIKPRVWGVSLNLPEIMRRGKKLFIKPRK